VGGDCLTDYYAPEYKRRNMARLADEPRFTFLRLDLSEAPLEGLLEGIDVVYHLAGQPGVRNSFGERFETYLRNNVLATQRLLEQAAVWPLGAFVYASSSAVYGDALMQPTSEDAARQPISPYGITKVAVEDLAGVYGGANEVPAIGIRYFTAYGPRQRPDMALACFLEQALAGSPVTIFGDGTQCREFTYVGDAVKATIAAATRGVPGAVYNIGGGACVSLLEVVGLLEDLLERPVSFEFQPRRRGDVRFTHADIARATEELGFTPATSLRDGLAKQLEWAVAEAGSRKVAA